MRISKSAQRINGEEVITDPKTPKSKRTIMLPDFLVRELKDYFLKIEYFSEDEQIFPKCKTYFNKEMERGIKKSKVPHRILLLNCHCYQFYKEEFPFVHLNSQRFPLMFLRILYLFLTRSEERR